MCEYQDANYSIRILNGDGRKVHQTSEMKYDNERSDSSVDLQLTTGMHKDTTYTAVITVTTAVNSTETRFTFSEY